jgi:hypothetical protein
MSCCKNCALRQALKQVPMHSIPEFESRIVHGWRARVFSALERDYLNEDGAIAFTLQVWHQICRRLI